MLPEKSEINEERDAIYIINKFNLMVNFPYAGQRYKFPYDVPVLIDYTDHPELLDKLLSLPELRPCLKREVREYQEKVRKTEEARQEATVVADSVVEEVLSEEENSNEKNS